MFFRFKKIFLFTIVILFFSTFLNVYSFSFTDTNKKYFLDLTGDGIKETVEIILDGSNYDVKISNKSGSTTLSSLLPEKCLCDAHDINIFKIRFINISRDNKPEILIQGFKDSNIINYIFSYNVKKKKFELKLTTKNTIIGVIDSNLNRTPSLLSLDYGNDKNSISSFMLINNSLIKNNRLAKNAPGIHSIFQLINFINMDFESNSKLDIFTDTIPPENLNKLWKLDKYNFDYSFINGFFFDQSLDESSEILTATWILSFQKKDKRTNKVSNFDLEINLSKSYYNDLRISNIIYY